MKQLAPTKVPAIWFDLYVRFLPGTAFVFLNSERLGFSKPSDSLLLAALSFFTGYFIGHALQPLASALARRAELRYITDEELNKNDLAVREDRREKELQSKQYSEIASFGMMCILAIIHLSITLLLPVFSLIVSSAAIHSGTFLSTLVESFLSILAATFFYRMCLLRAQHSGNRKKRMVHLSEDIKAEKYAKKEEKDKIRAEKKAAKRQENQT